MSGQAGSEGGPVRPEDVDVTLAVLRDMGSNNERAVIGEFLDRVGSAIDQRVDARVDARTPPVSRSAPERRPSVALPIVSIVSGIPITGIVLGVTEGSLAGVLLMVITWVAIAAINVAHSRRT